MNEGKEADNFQSNNFKLTGRTKIFTMLKEQKGVIEYKSQTANFRSRKRLKIT